MVTYYSRRSMILVSQCKPDFILDSEKSSGNETVWTVPAEYNVVHVTIRCWMIDGAGTFCVFVQGRVCIYIISFPHQRKVYNNVRLRMR